MKPVGSSNEYPQLRSAAEIPVPLMVLEVLKNLDKRQTKLLFENLRLDLQSRVSTLEDRELIKLQGKLDYLGELENFFTSLLK
jgi:hypothetical protein